MKLSVVLFASKTLTDGTHPIMLRLFHHGKYYHKSLNLSCKKSDWNDKDKECRKSFTRHASFNRIIRDSKTKTQSKIDEMLATKAPFLIDAIFEPTKELERKTLIQVIEEHKSQYTKFNTIEKYLKLIRKLREFGYANVLIDEVDANLIKSFYSRLKVGRLDTTVYTFMAVFDATLNTAVQNGYIPENPFKYTSFRYDKKTKKRALSKFDIDKLIEYYRDKYVESIYSNQYSLSKVQSEYYALNLFLSSYYLQGLSLVDLAALKVKDVVISDLIKDGGSDYKQYHQRNNDKQFFINELRQGVVGMKEQSKLMIENLIAEYDEKGSKEAVEKTKIMTIETHRSKTRKPVKIVHKYATVWFLLYPNMKGKAPDDYLFNVFNQDCQDDNKYQIHRLTHITNSCNKILNKVKDDLELNIDKLTLYCARHTYASVLYHNGISPNIIAQNLARDMRDIEVYLKQFDDEKIIQSNDFL